MGTVIDRLDLECKSGSKDAVYHLQLEQVDGGFVVNYQNGRRGGTLTPGTKTKSPVSMDAARKVFDKVAREKMTAQPPYVRSAGSVGSFQAVSEEVAERSTGLEPQLLNDVPEGQLEAILSDDGWVGEMKIDGERRMARATADGVIGSNRRGLRVPLPEVIESGLRGLVCEIDGEIIGDRLFVFDVLSLGDKNLRGEGYRERRRVLSQMERFFGSAVTVVPLAVGEYQKRALVEGAKALGQEGCVFKRVDAPYTPGRPNSGGTQLRQKNWKDCTVIVLGANSDRRSVRMGVVAADGKIVEVGYVTVPANREIPESGSCLDVKYLYAFEGGDLFLPQFKCVRSDLSREDASQARLEYKREHVDVSVAEDGAAPARSDVKEQASLF